MPNGLNHARHEVDVCVIGGGMAGLCAAVASARNGARTVLVQDRSVLGGNASSEIRMWVCGAHGENNKETGLLEEIQLANLARNPSLEYTMWDHVLWEKARFQPNLTLLLNTSICDAQYDGTAEAAHVTGVKGWQSPSQTWHTVEADYFIDCSGDSILAPLTPAAWRSGRESRDEFGEPIQPAEADAKSMGNSILIQTHRCLEPQPFTPPAWAWKFETMDDVRHRLNSVNPRNFWWLELGGLQDTIRDAETIRDDLLAAAYGTWDFIKNRHPEREKAENWAIHWIGSHPGKRENRRYEGDHILKQQDVEAGGAFEDVVAFGGWSMDDHHPAGLLYPGEPTIFHPAPSPYGIPYRSLYSRNVDNLLFAGRNISVTHAALSSTRVMATCAVIGQAAGTAAALCTKHGRTPRQLYQRHLKELQQTLMDDDCWLPGFTRAADPLAEDAILTAAGNARALLDGTDRDRPGETHAWEGACGEAVEYRFAAAQAVGGVRLVFDSNLNNDKRMPAGYPQKGDVCRMPASLVKAFRIAVEEGGTWRTVYREANNTQRLVRVPLQVRAAAVRLVPEATWGHGTGEGKARLFGFEVCREHMAKLPTIPQGPLFSDLRAAQKPQDLAAPASDGDAAAEKARPGAAIPA
ncbi:MAG: FAD-dependent oxidoreductase [Phycisphaerae bacterium]